MKCLMRSEKATHRFGKQVYCKSCLAIVAAGHPDLPLALLRLI